MKGRLLDERAVAEPRQADFGRCFEMQWWASPVFSAHVRFGEH
jgi:hypothetical protein